MKSTADHGDDLPISRILKIVKNKGRRGILICLLTVER